MSHPLSDMLAEHGVESDGILLVHSAFAGLSRQGWRVEQTIDALCEHLFQGTVLMPTMSWRIVTPEAPLFDELATPSQTGVLTEIFRTRTAQGRSLHPTHSVAGWGARAQDLLATHHRGETPCPAASPYGLMRGQGALILLLGVGMESCTAIHHVEESIAPELYLRPSAEAEAYTLRDRHGIDIAFRLRRHLRLNRDFQQFADRLAADGKLAQGLFGPVAWSLFRLDDLYDLVFASLRRRPDAIIAA